MNLQSPAEFLSVFKVTTRERWNLLAPIAIVLLSVIGVAFIYSAQLSTHVSDWWKVYWVKQAIFLVLGAGVYVATSLIDYRFWLSVAHWIYAASIFTLCVVFLFPELGGAQRWIQLGPFSFQPSETAKIAILLMVASVLIRNEIGTVRQSLSVLGKLALAVGLPLLLILKQPDLKSAIVLPPMVFSMLYVSKLSARFFASALAIFLLIVGLVGLDTLSYANFISKNYNGVFSNADRYAWTKVSQSGPHSWLPYLHDYQRNRILDFINPGKYDAKRIGWNQAQSLISVGSGGLTGKGWTEGTQAQLGYLPRSVAHTDFIFSVIAEEKGFVGSLVVVGLFGLLLFNGIRVAGLARDRLGTVLAIGVTVMFAVHVFVNIAMTIGLTPVTGIPLPFISYGGSFVLSCCVLQGLVQSVYRFRKDFT